MGGGAGAGGPWALGGSQFSALQEVQGEVLAAWWACQVRNKPLTQGFAQAHK